MEVPLKKSGEIARTAPPDAHDAQLSNGQSYISYYHIPPPDLLVCVHLQVPTIFSLDLIDGRLTSFFNDAGKISDGGAAMDHCNAQCGELPGWHSTPWQLAERSVCRVPCRAGEPHRPDVRGVPRRDAPVCGWAAVLSTVPSGTVWTPSFSRQCGMHGLSRWLGGNRQRL